MKAVFYSLSSVILSLLAAGCTYDHPTGYTSAGYGNDVVSSPRYEPVTVTPAYSPSSAELQRTADDNLAAAVRREFGRYGDLAALSQNVDVSADKGTVTLTGNVPTSREREMFGALVKNTPGVVHVNNRLEATGPVTTAVYPTGDVGTTRVYQNSGGDIFNLHLQGMSDADLVVGQRILEDLRADPSLRYPGSRVDIYVANGKTTLKGNVSSEEQRQAIGAAARSAAGVDNVRNDLRVQ